MKDVSLATGLREATYLIYASGITNFNSTHRLKTTFLNDLN